ncbi:MAG: hypothetical protein M1418_06130 [Deltaproteobacteria bacterium]|nr:hypothetical protein [Deltaproteobacteria bacterium]
MTDYKSYPPLISINRADTLAPMLSRLSFSKPPGVMRTRTKQTAHGPYLENILLDVLLDRVQQPSDRVAQLFFSNLAGSVEIVGQYGFM